MTTQAPLTFTERVHNLPPELFTLIMNPTLQYDEPETVIIDETYTFPKHLHIDTMLREEFARRYFSNTTFRCNSAYHLEKWLQAVPSMYKTLIKRVEYTPYDSILFEKLELNANMRQLNGAVRAARVVFESKEFVDLVHQSKLFVRLFKVVEKDGRKEKLAVWVPF